MKLNPASLAKVLPITFILLILFVAPAAAVAGAWSANGSTIYYTDGNVGIGTTAPDYKLSVIGGNPSLDTNVLKLGSVDTRAWQIKALKYGDTTYGDYALQLEQPAYEGGCTGACRGDLVLKPGRNLMIPQGAVGIGTAPTPNVKFEVKGGSNWAGRFTNTNSDVRFAYPGGYGIFVQSTTTNPHYLIRLYNNSNLKFYVNHDGSACLGKCS